MRQASAMALCALFTVAVFGVAGCDTRSSETQGEDAAQAWIDAVAAGDTEAACSLMAEREDSRPPWPRYCSKLYFPPESEMRTGFSEVEIVSVKREGAEVLVLITGLKGGFGTPLTRNQAEALGMEEEYDEVSSGNAKTNRNAAIISTGPYDDEYKVRYSSTFG